MALWGVAVWAQAAGSVVQLTGTLSAQRGSDTLILAMKSQVQRGGYLMVTQAGQITIGAGQFGFANDPNKPPVLLAGDPGLGLNPIPFALGATNPAQECVVR